jgi:hypothetical protein
MIAVVVLTASIVAGFLSAGLARVARDRRRARLLAESRARLLERVDEIVTRAEFLDAAVDSLGHEASTDTGVWDAIGAHHEWLLRAAREVHRVTETRGTRKASGDLERALLRFDLEVCRSRSLILRRPAPDDDRCKLAIAAVRDCSSELLETARFTRIVAHAEC